MTCLGWQNCHAFRFTFLLNFALFQGPDVKYQKQKFCCGKDLKEGRWLILGNMQREFCTFSAFS